MKVKLATELELKQFPIWFATLLDEEQGKFLTQLKEILGEEPTQKWMCTMMVISGRFQWSEDASTVFYVQGTQPGL